MAHFILLLVGAAVVAVIGFGVTWLIAGRDRGLAPAQPDERAVPLPTSRPLIEDDVIGLRFDTTVRGYRMGQVDAALRRAAYDIGYKQELINVLEAENEALRDGRVSHANVLREARDRSEAAAPAAERAEPVEPIEPAEPAEPIESAKPADDGAIDESKQASSPTGRAR